MGTDNNDDGEIDAGQTERILVLKERVNQVQLQVPSAKPQVVNIEQLKAGPKTEPAADVAISVRDISLVQGRLTVKVHNVGSLAAKNITVELWSDKKKIAAGKIAQIDAPDDLVPRWKTISFKPGTKIESISVKVFTDQTEITTFNNAVSYHLTR
ncbi:hypothetical protein D3C86_1749890 [compost metagenome]